MENLKFHAQVLIVQAKKTLFFVFVFFPDAHCSPTQAAYPIWVPHVDPIYVLSLILRLGRREERSNARIPLNTTIQVLFSKCSRVIIDNLTLIIMLSRTFFFFFNFITSRERDGRRWDNYTKKKKKQKKNGLDNPTISHKTFRSLRINRNEKEMHKMNGTIICIFDASIEKNDTYKMRYDIIIKDDIIKRHKFQKLFQPFLNSSPNSDEEIVEGEA
jgi:hypothetical protein